MSLQAAANKYGVWCQGEQLGWFLIFNPGVPLGPVGREVKLADPPVKPCGGRGHGEAAPAELGRLLRLND